MRNEQYFSDEFRRKSAANKKMHLEKVEVHNRKTMFIKEVAGALVLLTIAGVGIAATKAMVDEYSKKHGLAKSAAEYHKMHEDEIPTTEAATRMEESYGHYQNNNYGLNTDDHVEETTSLDDDYSVGGRNR